MHSVPEILHARYYAMPAISMTRRIILHSYLGNSVLLILRDLYHFRRKKTCTGTRNIAGSAKRKRCVDWEWDFVLLDYRVLHWSIKSTP